MKTLTATIQLFDGVFETTLRNFTMASIAGYAKRLSDDQTDQLQDNILLLYSAMDCTISASSFYESLYKVLDKGSPEDVLKVLKKGKFIVNNC